MAAEKTGPARLLVVDDEPGTADYLSELLLKEGHEADIAHNLEEANAFLSARSYAAVLCDVRLDNEDGTAILPAVKATQQECLTIFITGFGSMDGAVRAIHEGAFDYISKPLDFADIEADLNRVVKRALKQREAVLAGSSISIPSPMSLEKDQKAMIGTAPSMIGVYRSIAHAALTRENVLITGESGTGKELVATAVHEKSQWADKPFVIVNCCALSENLLESELFGHVRGAFTGAIQGKRGLFEEADGGTLFLDEIGDITPGLQVRLLRAIQEGEIKPVGSTTTRKVSVRVVAATNRDLGKEVQDGKFREDLYYRLKVITIEMPPLRDRMQDVPALVQYFVTRMAKKTAKTIKGVSKEAMALLLKYPWPGNIRELENAIGRAAAMASSQILFPEDFPPEMTAHSAQIVEKEEAEPQAIAVDPETAGGNSLEDLERRHIAHILQSVGNNKSKAAEILGIDRVTLYRKAFKYGLMAKGAAKAGAPDGSV